MEFVTTTICWSDGENLNLLSIVNKSPENLLTSGRIIFVVLNTAPILLNVAPDAGILLSRYDNNIADSVDEYATFFSITLNVYVLFGVTVVSVQDKISSWLIKVNPLCPFVPTAIKHVEASAALRLTDLP